VAKASLPSVAQQAGLPSVAQQEGAIISESVIKKETIFVKHLTHLDTTKLSHIQKNHNKMATTFAAFPLETKLEQRVYTFIDEIRETEDPIAYRKELSELVRLLTDAGLEYYFWKPVELTGLGAVTQKMIRVGLNSGKKTLHLIANKVIKGFTEEQLLTIAGFLESLLLEVEMD